MNRIATTNWSDISTAIYAARPSGVPRIAMIGCGIIAERYHLPALAAHPQVLDALLLVDPDSARTAHLSAQFAVRAMAPSITGVVDEIDAAIVAVPPALHYPICMELLEHGVHVLCEKPLTESPVHAAEMVARATERGLALCVNHTRRLYPAYELVRQLVTEENLGPLREIRYEEGFEFSWPATSAFHFRSGARGVLLDTGIHALDVLCWWLGSKPEFVRCQTDSFGGPEATAHLELCHGDCRVDLKLSWLNKLANQFTIVGERGTITGGVSQWDRLTIDHQNGKRELIRIPRCEKSYNEFGRRMIDNFLAVIAGRAESLVPAHEVLPAIELMEQSYRAATRLALPWLEWQKEVVDG